MKRVYLSMIAILGVIGVIYAWEHRSNIGVLREWLPGRTTESMIDTGGN